MIIKEILQYFFPTIASRLAVVLMNFGVLIMIGYSGLTNLAAYGLVTPIFFTVYLMALGFMIVFTVRAAKIIEDKKRLSRYVTSAAWLSLCIALVTIIIFTLIPHILPYLGQSLTLVHLAKQYFWIITLGMPGLLFSVVMNQLMIVLKQKRCISIAAYSQLILGLSLVALFILIFHWGLMGAALGVVLSYWYKAIFFWIFTKRYCRENFQFQLITLAEFKEDAGFLLKLGWPMSLQYGGELIAGSIAALMIGHIYAHALAAQQVALQLRTTCLMIAFALSQACVIIVGRLGHDAWQVFKAALLVGSLLMGGILLIVNLFSQFFIGLFIHAASSNILHWAEVFIVLTSIALMVEVLRYVLMGILRANENTRQAMKYSLLMMWVVGLPLAYLLGYQTTLGVIGVRVGMLVGLIASTSALFLYCRRFLRISSRECVN